MQREARVSGHHHAGAASGWCVVVLGVLGLAGCDRATSADSVPSAATSQWVAEVDVVRPVRKDVSREIQLPVILFPWQRTDLVAKVSGYVQTIPGDRGTQFKQGDLLAKLWVPELEAELEERKAHLRGAEAHLRGAEAWLKFAELVARRANALVPQRGTSQQECEEHDAVYLRAIAEVDAHREQLVIAQQRIKITEALLEYTFIRGPYDGGNVTQRNVHEGQFVDHTKALALFHVDQANVVRATIDVPEHESPLVKVGTPVRIMFPELGPTWLPGKVTRSSNVLETKTRTLRIEADYPNPDLRMLPGMFGQAILTLETHEGALTVPSDAILRATGTPTVFTIENGLAKGKPVQVGIDDGKTAEVLAGLEPDEEIIGIARGLSNATPVRKREGGK